MIEDKHAAFLFGNGNAMYFDQSGEQIVEFQEYGLSGVHLFTDEYPEAPVYWSIWEEAASEVHENVFDYIRDPWEVRDVGSQADKTASDLGKALGRELALREADEFIEELEMTKLEQFELALRILDRLNYSAHQAWTPYPSQKDISPGSEYER